MNTVEITNNNGKISVRSKDNAKYTSIQECVELFINQSETTVTYQVAECGTIIKN